MNPGGGKREVRILVDEELYRELEKKALERGFRDVSSYITELLSEKTLQQPGREGDLEKIRARLERFVQDEINKGLAPLETVRRQVSELVQRVEELEEKVKALEQQGERRPAETYGEARTGKPYKSGIERLRDDKVVFESTLPARVQRDRLFSYFERMGAVVLRLGRERVAVDSGFWREFKEKLFGEVKSNSEEELKRVLGEKGYLLWKALYEDNMVIYDPKTRSWKPASDELAGK